MENKIAIGSLATILSKVTGKSKKICDDFLKEYFGLLTETLEKGESVKIKGFGTFKVTAVESRESVNVNTGERVEIASYKKVVFTPSKDLAEKINAPFVDFETIEMDDDIPEEILEDSIEEEKNNDENKINPAIIEAGSEEEEEDDKISLTAYTYEESEKGEAVTEENTLDKLNNLETPKEESTKSETKEIQDDTMLLSGDMQSSVQESDIETPKETEKISQYELYETEEPMKSRFGIGFLIGALSTLLVCVIIFMLGCFLDWWPMNMESVKTLLSKETPEEIINSEDLDQTNYEPKIKPISTSEDISDTESKDKPQIYDTVSKTRYLTTIAREHYGNYNFWPYIYKENENILGHPDRITPGTKVVVPDLSKYGVDPNNKEDIAKAKKMGLEIYSRYR